MAEEGMVERFMETINKDSSLVVSTLIHEYIKKEEGRHSATDTTIAPWSFIIDSAAMTMVMLLNMYCMNTKDMAALRELRERNPGIDSVLRNKAKVIITNQLLLFVLGVFAQERLSKTTEPEKTLEAGTQLIAKITEANAEYAISPFYLNVLFTFVDLLEQALIELSVSRKTLIMFAHFPKDPKTAH